MDHHGFLSLLPPLLAIVLAIYSRQVYLALLSGIYLGWLILSDFNPWLGLIAMLEGLVAVFADAGNTRTILFSALVGALIALVQRSGGVAGFVQRMEGWLGGTASPNQRKKVELASYLSGLLIFVESSISVLTVGAIFRPLFDRLKIPREKLAYLADSSSAPSCILIPFNAWGAYLMSLLAGYGIAQPFGMLIKAFPYNFYPMLTVGLAVFLILSRKDFGPMKKAEHRAVATGAVLRPGAQPLVSEEVTSLPPAEGAKPRMRNLLLPIGLMVLLMPVLLAYTGWEAVTETAFLAHAGQAIGQGSGSSAVLYSVCLTLLFCFLFYRIQGLLKVKEMMELSLKGLADLMPLALLMLLAFAIGNVCKALGTGLYTAELVRGWLSPAFVPALVFLLSGFIAFSTGTSWGTFAIMISIALPVAEQLEASFPLTLAAVMGGGVFGDHCSPISDTTILSSMASASDHIDHVRTQLPYALLSASGAFLLYLLMGIFGV